MPPLTAAKEASLITRLPVGRRTEVLNRISANANAPGGCKRQTGGRGWQGAQRMAVTMGIYPIETTRTGTQAYNVGGASPASITIELGTPTSTVVAANELDPVTWAAPGTVSLSVQVTPTLAGNAKLVVV